MKSMKFNLLQDGGKHGVVVVDKLDISVDKNTDKYSKKRDDKVVCQHAKLLSSVAVLWSESLVLSLSLSLSLSLLSPYKIIFLCIVQPGW